MGEARVTTDRLSITKDTCGFVTSAQASEYLESQVHAAVRPISRKGPYHDYAYHVGQAASGHMERVRAGIQRHCCSQKYEYEGTTGPLAGARRAGSRCRLCRQPVGQPGGHEGIRAERFFQAGDCCPPPAFLCRGFQDYVL